MQKNPNRLNLAKVSLRIGLAVAFLYAAIGSFLQPDIWIGFLPAFLGSQPFAPTLLKVFSTVEILLSLWILSGKKGFWAGLLAATMLSGIVISNISDLTVSFRDLALIFAAFALVLLS